MKMFKKTIISTAVASTLVASLAAASLAQAAGTVDEAKRAVQIGTEYGITHFHSIELDDDFGLADSRIELEGWVDSEWYVELDVNTDGSIQKEQRRKRNDGPWGMSSEQALSYIDASVNEGMQQIEEISADSRGNIEVDGNNANGQELEIDYRNDSMTPRKVELDDRS
jgi:hypothetical protein